MHDYKNLLEWAYHWEKNAPDRRYLTQPMGGSVKNVKTWTFAEALGEARRMATYLKSLDFPEKSNIALCSKNCAYWLLADLAIWMAGHVSVPLFPVLTAETTEYILTHSESKLLFVGKLDPIWGKMQKAVPEDLPKIAFPLAPQNDHPSWDDIVQQNEPLLQPVDRSADELATIIYTSGSTGKPKGAMIGFGAMCQAAAGLSKVISSSADDRMFSYLPLAHALERWLIESHSLYGGIQVFFAESLDTFVQDLQRARPTLFVSVPRLWLKFQIGVYAKLPPAKFNRLMKIPIVRSLVKKKILRGLGLDQVRYAGSGSAPIPKELIEWYLNLGVELLEAYGMSENFCYSHTTRPGQIRAGFVGTPYHDVTCRLSAEGEIQVQSPANMMGYYKMPEESKAAFSADGFLRTGDCGEVDEKGRLRITGRIKERFKTSKGEYVAPAPIENLIVNHPRVEMCCVCGSGYPQPYALLQLTDEAMELIESGGKARVEEELIAHLAQVNSQVQTYERIQFFSVVWETWLPENGFLTPTLKIKRNKLEETFRQYNEEWYEQKTPIIYCGSIDNRTPSGSYRI